MHTVNSGIHTIDSGINTFHSLARDAHIAL